MGINCCDEDSFDEVEPCELSEDDLAVGTIADELEPAETVKIPP